MIREHSFYSFPIWQAITMDIIIILLSLTNGIHIISDLVLFLFIVSSLYTIARDWSGIATLRGMTDPSAMKQGARGWYIIGYIMFFPLFLAIYDVRMTIESIQSYRDKKAQERIDLQQRIRRLEKELGM